MNSHVSLETSVVAANRSDLLPPSSNVVEPSVAGASIHDNPMPIWPYFLTVALALCLIFVFKKISGHNR